MFSNIYNKFRRITTNQLYFPEIDGIRFIAIILVVLFHINGYFTSHLPFKFVDDGTRYSVLNKLLINGDRGVEFFFVLSGFILCLPFAHHYINNGKRVSLKKYYLRRLTRLEPPYFIAITALFVLNVLVTTQPVSVLLPSWLASLVYSHNLIFHRTPLLTVVAWSLEIEIQFYLLAPIFFRLLSLSKLSRRTILFVLSATLVVLHSFFPPSFKSIFGFGQYFFAGILLADFYVSDTASSFFNRKWISLTAIPLFFVIMYWPLPLKNPFMSVKTLCVWEVFFPFAIALFFYIILKNDLVKRVFSFKFIPIIGGMCYSIYLLHYTIISFLGKFTMRFHFTEYYLPNLLLQFVLLCVPVLIISSVFYLYIERPFMSRKWMDKLMKNNKKEEEAIMEVKADS